MARIDRDLTDLPRLSFFPLTNFAHFIHGFGFFVALMFH